MFNLSLKSLAMVNKLHPSLNKVVRRAIQISKVDFTVAETTRTLERQRELVKAGASQTLRSRHIPGANGWGHAVDLAPFVNGKARWDWPLFYILADAMKKAAKELKVPIEWGGDWKRFKDGPHFQLPWKEFPGTKGT